MIAKLRRGIRAHRGFLTFLLLLGVTRTALADWNHVPTASMQPTILEGDLVFVNRVAYDLKLPLTQLALTPLGEPARGDVVVFASPGDGTRLIKRLVGLPGDLIEMRDRILIINGAPASYAVHPGGATSGRQVLSERLGAERHFIQWQRERAAPSRFGPLRIPADHFLMLGDNRDHSADSRYFGLVARRLLIGRAERILVSADITGDWLPRFERFGLRLR